MRTIEQIAIKTADINRRILDMGKIFQFDRNIPKESKWIRDHVQAAHVYLHPSYLGGHVGSEFEVELAFNYDVLEYRELELIRLVKGQSVQILTGEPGEGLAHLGYHIPNHTPLISEVEWWNSLGYVCAQVSATVIHSNTPKRYVYAFIDTRTQIGAYTKVISRLDYPRELGAIVEEFLHINKDKR